MAHRPRTWWRAIVGAVVVSALVGPLGLATLDGASAAGATAPALIHQQAITTVGPGGSATLTLDLAAPTGAVLRVALYPALITRGALEQVVAGQGPGVAPIASTAPIPLDCLHHGVASITLTVTTSRRAGVPTCAGARPRLALVCAPAGCDGVYPLRLTVTGGGGATVVWSLVTIHTRSTVTPLSFALVETLTHRDLGHPARTAGALRAIARLSATPVTISADYGALGPMVVGKAAKASGPTEVATALSAALASGVHRAVDAAPAQTDFAGLADHHLDTQVVQQLDLSSNLLGTLTGRTVDAPVLVTGAITPTGLRAIARAGGAHVVLGEADLASAPSSTLAWGAPFRVAGAPGALALASDGPLSALFVDAALPPGQRTALVMGTLSFLHFEEPNAPFPRSVVLDAPLSATSPVLLSDLAAGLANDPYVRASTLAPLFDPRLVGTDGAPSTRSLGRGPSSYWSTRNVSTLLSVIGEVNSFAGAVRSGPEATALRVAVAGAEDVGGPAARQAAIARAQGALDEQLGLFSIDTSTITLAGTGSSLPVTVHSHADYTIAAVAHVSAEGLSFPRGSAVVVDLDAPTVSVTVPTAHPRASSVTLQVVLTSPNGQLVLARSAVQVHLAGTSLVGYLLIAVALAMLAWWWWRTSRKRPAGRHAR
jgi:hypothetical protein